MSAAQKPLDLKVSKLSENIIGSEIIKLAAEVNEKIKKGEKIYNLTIGDFNPKVFPIPAELKQNIVDAYFDQIKSIEGSGVRFPWQFAANLSTLFFDTGHGNRFFFHAK